MKHRKIYLFALAIAIFVFVCLALLERPRRSTLLLQLKFDEQNLVITDFPINEKSNLVVGIQNPNSCDIRVVGIAGSCGLGGCAEPVDFESFILESGEQKSVTIEFKAPKLPGRIEVAMVVYYASDSVVSKEFLITGNAVDPE
jgi:hypothetical protein